MFDYDLAHWSAFLAAAFILNISPGPDLIFILGHTAKAGKRAGIAAMLGIWTGAAGHIALAAIGLSALIAASATAFAIVKWVGAAYLIWIGIKAIRSNGEEFIGGENVQVEPLWSVFRQGMFTNLLNPKVAVFFLAFLPHFVVENAGPVWAQLMLHGVLIILIAAIIEPPLVLMGDKLTTKLRQSKSLALWLERTFGTVLIALGLRLALSEK